MFRNLKRASTGISLVLLWLVFSLLGILSFITGYKENLRWCLRSKEYCLAGSAAAFLLERYF